MFINQNRRVSVCLGILVDQHINCHCRQEGVQCFDCWLFDLFACDIATRDQRLTDGLIGMPLPGHLDEAIAGCQAWLKISRLDDDPERRLDCARTHFRLAELCWERLRLALEREEGRTLLDDALQNIQLAIESFGTQASDSFQKAQHLRITIQREIRLRDLDDAIAGCKALLKLSQPAEDPLDWARTQTRLAQLYWDRALQSEHAEERSSFFDKEIQRIDQALPVFRQPAPVSYTRVQNMRERIEAARKKMYHSPL
jgi:hypothetical protein